MADKIISGAMKILMFVGSVLGGFISVSLMINTLVYCPLSSAIAAERTDREKAIAIEVSARIAEDKEIFNKIEGKLDTILNQTSDIKVNLAAFGKQVEVNTKRLDTLEKRVR